MAYIAIAIWVLIIIGAFSINAILGWIVLLGSILMLGGGLDGKNSRAKSAPDTKHQPANTPKLTPQQLREQSEKADYYEKLYGD